MSTLYPIYRLGLPVGEIFYRIELGDNPAYAWHQSTEEYVLLADATWSELVLESQEITADTAYGPYNYAGSDTQRRSYLYRQAGGTPANTDSPAHLFAEDPPQFTAQQVANAMNLAPVGEAAAGSVQAQLVAAIAAASSPGTLTADERAAIATAVLTIDWSIVTGEAAYSIMNALRFVRGMWRIEDNQLTVYKEDGTTAAWTATLATGVSQPVTGMTPG